MTGDNISRYHTSGGVETRTQPGSRGRVLRNLVEITRKQDMDGVEAEALRAAQNLYAATVGPDTRFTAAMLCRMHRDWLGRIYEWAGRYRNVELAKGAFQWPPARLVPEHMARFEAGPLGERTPCRPGSVQEIAEGMAEVHAELLLIHPFREGNGRLARWLAELMAAQAGLPYPDYGFEGRGARAARTRYLAAVTRGYVKDYRGLADFLAEALERRLGRVG